MNLQKLKQVAESATPIDCELYGDRYFQGSHSCAQLDKAQHDFVGAVSPRTALTLIAVAEAASAWKAVASLRQEFQDDEVNDLLAALDVLERME